MCYLFLFFMISLDIVGATRWSRPLLRGAKIAFNTSDAIAKESLSEAKKAYRPFVAKYALSNCTQCKSRKDYSSPCPEKWSIQEDSCQADKTYGGPCSSTQTFIGDSISERRQVEIMCKVCWPCKERLSCERNWYLPCPYGYSPAPIPYYEYASATKQSCVSDFQSECEFMVTFSDLTEKHKFSERCEAQWPCQESCASTSAVCPQRWIHIGDNLCFMVNRIKKLRSETLPIYLELCFAKRSPRWGDDITARWKIGCQAKLQQLAT